MHYTVGQHFRHLQVHAIKEEANGYNIYVEENGAVMLWKHVNRSVPVHLEYDLEGF